MCCSLRGSGRQDVCCAETDYERSGVARCRIISYGLISCTACEACPDSQDVWLEAARLHPPAEAKSILARAVTAVPTSVKVWMSAVRLEEDDKAKRAVLRRALELVPT